MTLVSEEFAENAYIVATPGQVECVVFDPGLQMVKLVDTLRQQGLTPVAILNTHGHADHIAGNEMVKEAWPNAPLLIGENDAVMLIDPHKNLSASFGVPITSPPADQSLRGGETIHHAGLSFEIRDAPGHSPGHIIYVLHDTDPIAVFGGDVLFEGGIGRTDFPGGSFEQLEDSIREQLYSLPDDTVVFPGHGPPNDDWSRKSDEPVRTGISGDVDRRNRTEGVKRRVGGSHHRLA